MSDDYFDYRDTSPYPPQTQVSQQEVVYPSEDEQQLSALRGVFEPVKSVFRRIADSFIGFLNDASNSSNVPILQHLWNSMVKEDRYLYLGILLIILVVLHRIIV